MSSPNLFVILRNSQTAFLDQVPHRDMTKFRRFVLDAVAEGWRVSAFFAVPKSTKAIELWAVLADDANGVLHVVKTSVAGESFPSLTPECPQVQGFEREIAEQWGLRSEGHPWLKPIRFHKSYRPEAHGLQPVGLGAESATVGVIDFYRVEGEEIHEVAVGPVHAGVIEPGHFRFQCHGEQVYHLEISLGYQHRGLERALMGGMRVPTGTSPHAQTPAVSQGGQAAKAWHPNKRTIHYMETLAGDTSVGHATAYCQALEALANCRVPARGQAIRGIALELERLANHTGDLGALAADVGYLPTASFCGRLRGDFLNATALLCGSRLGRGLIRPGGVGFDLDNARIDRLQSILKDALRDLTESVNLLWDTPSVQARFENTGPISKAICEELGLVGPAARACGVSRDVRVDFPTGIYRFAQIPVSTADAGDVFARAYVRWLEIQRSIAFILDQLKALPDGPIKNKVGSPVPGLLVVSLTEGWRGEICHVAMTDSRGHFARYKVVDPSFHNWMGLALALRNQQISDFPLCNKSFNLSYCGHDL
jgi:Ni,Fe-hydrogenase III large subunit/Ni,Fe-hydrogenase III component G